MKNSKRPIPGVLTDLVAQRVREQIATGQLSPGECVLSERDLSRQLRVSRVTVRRGLDQLVRDNLLRREPGRGYFLRDSSAPDGFLSGRTASGRGALVFLHNQSNDMEAGSYHGKMWSGAREEAARSGLLTMISTIREGGLTAEHAAELKGVAAGVLCDYVNRDAVRMLLQAGIIVVQIDYYRLNLPVDAVLQDDFGGIAMAVEHLYSRGHRRIGYLDTTAQLRVSGSPRNAESRAGAFWMTCNRLEINHRLVADASLEPPDGTAAAEKLLDAGATALVVPHGEIWPSVRAVLSKRGTSVPKGMGIVTWGDPPAGCNDFPTSVTWSKEQMGREGVRRLLLRLDRPAVEPVAVVIPTKLVDRDTGGRGPDA